MPEPEFRLVNVSRRPIEMHGRDGTVQVINPGDSVAASSAHADAAIHERSGALLRLPLPVPDKPAAAREARARPASGPGAHTAHPVTIAPPAAQRPKPRKGEPA
jgi:hypothetical protein